MRRLDSTGMSNMTVIDKLRDVLAMLAGDTSQPVVESGNGPVSKRIVPQDGEFCVFSEDGSRNFGCFPTEEAAAARLAEIEFFADKNLSDRPTAELMNLLSRVNKIEMDDAPLLASLVETELEKRADRAACTVCKADDDRRYTLGPVYVPGRVDAHGDFTDESTLQKALWGWVRKGDRTIRLQHTDKSAGEMVEVVTWPFEITTKVAVPGGTETDVTFPADTPFMGVVWEDWAWELVKAGELRGYSMGGRARKVEAEFSEQ